MPPQEGTKHAIIYTDGACSGNGVNPNAKAGIGVYWENTPANNISEPLEGRQTNQRAEIKAATRGIMQARDQGFKSVTVKTDSQYVKNAAELWIPIWKKTNWSKHVVNKEEFKELDKSMKGIEVKFEHVPSANNAADKLAREATRKLLTIASLCRKVIH